MTINIPDLKEKEGEAMGSVMVFSSKGSRKPSEKGRTRKKKKDFRGSPPTAGKSRDGINKNKLREWRKKKRAVEEKRFSNALCKRGGGGKGGRKKAMSSWHGQAKMALSTDERRMPAGSARKKKKKPSRTESPVLHEGSPGQLRRGRLEDRV